MSVPVDRLGPGVMEVVDAGLVAWSYAALVVMVPLVLVRRRMRVGPALPWQSGLAQGWGSSALAPVVVGAVGWVLGYPASAAVVVAEVPPASGRTYGRRLGLLDVRV